MNEDDRFSVLAIFQTLKAKTSRLLDPVVQSEGLTLLQACVLGHLYQQDAAVGDISDLAVIDQANASAGVRPPGGDPLSHPPGERNGGAAPGPAEPLSGFA